MVHDVKYLESLNRAKELAYRNGGVLPSVSRLIDHKEHGILRAIRTDRAPFEPILAKMGRGRDKAKYAYVQDHMDEPNDELANHLGLSKTTIANWKAEINESQFTEVDPSETPDEVFAEDMAEFVVRNLPKGWRLDVSHDADGCCVTVVQPNGMRRDIEGVYGASLTQSVVAHVNYARKKSGLAPVAWGE